MICDISIWFSTAHRVTLSTRHESGTGDSRLPFCSATRALQIKGGVGRVA